MATDRFDLLHRLYGDQEMTTAFGPEEMVRSWLAVESALARAQGELGLIPTAAAAAIAQACTDDSVVDTERLWESARNVGYPILGLVRQLDAAVPEEHRGVVHLGATTQDIMDTGLALQLRAGTELVAARLQELGDTLAGLVDAHRTTVLAGRTHGQQAVPTTFGAKLAVFLTELARHRARIAAAIPDVTRVALFGAGGTAAALGSRSAKVRSQVAALLGLADADVPMHVARDGLVHVAQVVAAASTTCGRLAREVIDLARTEIGEVHETAGHHRGASSTMPQKANPITSEAIVGFAAAAASAAAGIRLAMDARHERAAGEWQAEWMLLPAVFVDAGSALLLAAELAAGLRVDAERMRENLSADHGLVMAEAVMIRLAPHLGRERSHDVVYELALQARAAGTTLAEAVTRWQHGQPELAGIDLAVAPDDYLGETAAVCDAALRAWRSPEPTTARR